MKEKKSALKFWEIYGYGFSGMFVNTFFLMFLAYYLLYYLTNVWGIPPIVAAVVYSAAMWIRTGTIVTSGIVIDNTNLRWGKYRSWVYLGALILLVGTTLLFTDLNIASQAVAIAVFLILYAIAQFGYSALWVSQRAMLGKMAKTNNDAIALTSSAQMMSSLGGIVYGLVGATFLGMWGGSEQRGYTFTAILYGLFIVVGCIIFGAITKKYEPSRAKGEAAVTNATQKKERIGIIKLIKNLKGPMIPFFLAMIIGNAQLGFFMALLRYFTKYVLNDPKAFGLAITLGSVGAVVGAYAAKPLCKKYSKKLVWIFVMIITGILYALISFIGRTSLPFLILRVAVSFMGSFIGVLLPAIANDVSDHSEMNGGESARAFTQSMGGTAIKLGAVISGMAASFGLAFVGYEKGAEMTPELINGITYMMAFGPALVSFLSAAIFIFYKVDEKKLDEYRSQKEAAVS